MSDVADLKKSTIPPKPVCSDTEQTLSDYSDTVRSHNRLVIIVTLGVFFSEIVVLAVALRLPFSEWLYVIFVAALLVFLLCAFLCFSRFRPMVKYINAHDRTETALRMSKLRFRTGIQTCPHANITAWMHTGLQAEVNQIKLEI